MRAMGTRVPQGRQRVNDYKIQRPLEIVILSEVSQRKTSTIWHCLHVESKKVAQMNLLTNRNSHRCRDLWLPGGKGQFSSVAQSCPTLCDPMSRSTPGLPVHHQLPEFTQTHVHQVGDAIKSSHPLSSPSPPAFSLSQHQGLFQWVSSLYQVAKGLEFRFCISPSNEYSGLISFRMDWLDLLSNTTVQKHQFFSTQLSL